MAGRARALLYVSRALTLGTPARRLTVSQLHDQCVVPVTECLCLPGIGPSSVSSLSLGEV